MDMDPNPGMKSCKQARSERTLRKILDATEVLLETRPFDGLSVQEITRKAGVATGCLHTRFESKAAVLEILFERYLADTERIAVAGTEESAWSDLPLEERIRGMCFLLVRTFRARRGVSRAAQVHYMRFPELVSERMRKRMEAMYERIARVILGDAEGIHHDDPLWAARFALQTAVATCRAKILFHDHPVPDAAPAADRKLIDELTRLLLGYLSPRIP